MKKFWDLFNFEYNRFANMLFPSLLIAFAVELGGLVFLATSYKNGADHFALQNPGWTAEQIVSEMGGPFSLIRLIASPFFIFPFIGIIMIFIVYSLYTWYREWFGKNTFVYRLFTLPIPRLQVYFAKVLVFIVGGLMALMSQFLIFFAYSKIATWIVSTEFMDPTSFYNYLTTQWTVSGMFYSTSPSEFLHLILSLVTALSVLYVVILAERSFRTKGLVAGIILMGLYIFMFVTIQSVEGFHSLFNIYLLPSEQLKYSIINNVTWFAIATLINRYLINNKVTV